jgi:hypothetical protein
MEIIYRWEVMHVSDCCGVVMNDDNVQHGICPDCLEHCEAVQDEYPVRIN